MAEPNNVTYLLGDHMPLSQLSRVMEFIDDQKRETISFASSMCKILSRENAKHSHETICDVSCFPDSRNVVIRISIPVPCEITAARKRGLVGLFSVVDAVTTTYSQDMKHMIFACQIFKAIKEGAK